MNRSILSLALMLAGAGAVAAAGFLATGCSTAPPSEEKKDALIAEADGTLNSMKATDSSFEKFLNDAHAYVVFPNVGKGGLVVGGAYGRGVAYRGGRMVGYADLKQATVGAQIGGQNYAEVIAFQDEAAFNRFTSNRLELTAQASAVALKSGVAANAKYTDGVAIFTFVKGGLMAEAAVGGQQFTFTRVDDARRQDRNRDRENRE
jgi:lipid-binding SYLF domain-containing protein